MIKKKQQQIPISRIKINKQKNDKDHAMIYWTSPLYVENLQHLSTWL